MSPGIRAQALTERCGTVGVRAQVGIEHFTLLAVVGACMTEPGQPRRRPSP